MFKDIFSFTISTILLMPSFVYIWKNVDGLKDKFVNKSDILMFIICGITAIINYIFTNDFIKPIISLIILIILCSYIMRKVTNRSIILAIYSQMLIFLSEIIFTLIILLFGENAETILNNYYGNILANIIIALMAINISKIKYNKVVYNKLISITDRINIKRLILVIIIAVFITSFLTVFFYYKIGLIYLLVFNIFVIIVYFIFIYNYLKANNNYLKVYDKYNMTLNSLKEYEDILSRYRISNHENKNQLLTIRNMVKSKKIISYIDEIIENKIKDNEKLMFDSMVIPEGGLRGLIYSKMLLMKENNIEFDLCVDKAIKTTNLTEINDDMMLNICNIIGVYIDNAIEAIKELSEKYIVIEMYLNDDLLNIAITNNYEGNIDIDSIDNIGYSTKGDGHGYGLSLVKEIISCNKYLSSEKYISEDEFTQELKVKYKNKI